MIKTGIGILIFTNILLLRNCEKVTSPQPVVFDTTSYTIPIPKGFPYMIIPPDNPTTLEGIQLGRMMFYDPIIDRENRRSCGQCHQQEFSFSSDTNSQPLVNLAWNNKYLWNGRIGGVLENIMLFEVEEFFQTDLSRINADIRYRGLFKKTFDADTITSKEIAYALAQFMRTIISNNSKWDLYLNGKIDLNEQEENGRDIYFTEKGDCFHCHGTILLTDNYFHNNGLDSIPASGRAEITQKQKDAGKFKTPTLRNIEMTAPYMHDGRFATLDAVIDFYCTGVKWSPTIDPMMKKVKQGGVHLSDDQKADLLAFLKTFTDNSLINNPGLSDPFKKNSY